MRNGICGGEGTGIETMERPRGLVIGKVGTLHALHSASVPKSFLHLNLSVESVLHVDLNTNI